MSVAPKLEPLTKESPLVMRATWALTAEEPEGAPVLVAQWVDRSVQVEGELGGGSVDGFTSNSGERYVVALSISYTDVVAAPVGAYFKPALYRPTPETRVRVSLVGRRP